MLQNISVYWSTAMSQLKHFSPLSAQGILFCTSECLKAPPDLLKIYLHESNRVYRDKLVEEKDFQLFDKLQADAVKKFYEVRILKYKQTKVQGWRKRERIIWLPALCLDLDISIQPRKSKQKKILGWRFRQRVGGNVNQCGTGVLLSESALSAGQIGKHFNGFLLTALPSTLPGCSTHTSHARMKNLTSVCVYIHPQQGQRIALPSPAEMVIFDLEIAISVKYSPSANLFLFVWFISVSGHQINHFSSLQIIFFSHFQSSVFIFLRMIVSTTKTYSESLVYSWGIIKIARFIQKNAPQTMVLLFLFGNSSFWSENELGHPVYSWGLQLSPSPLCLSFTLMLCWQGHCVVLYVYFCLCVGPQGYGGNSSTNQADECVLPLCPWAGGGQVHACGVLEQP